MSDHPMIEDIKAAAREQWKNKRDARAQEELRAKLAEVGPMNLAKMTDIELAAWQSHYPNP